MCGCFRNSYIIRHSLYSSLIHDLDHLQTDQFLFRQVFLANDLDRHFLSSALQNAPLHDSVFPVTQRLPKIHDRAYIHRCCFQLRYCDWVHIFGGIVKAINQIIDIGYHIGREKIRLAHLKVFKKGCSTNSMMQSKSKLQCLLSDYNFDRLSVLVRLNIQQVRFDIILGCAILQLVHDDTQIRIQLNALRTHPQYETLTSSMDACE